MICPNWSIKVWTWLNWQLKRRHSQSKVLHRPKSREPKQQILWTSSNHRHRFVHRWSMRMWTQYDQQQVLESWNQQSMENQPTCGYSQRFWWLNHGFRGIPPFIEGPTRLGIKTNPMIGGFFDAGHRSAALSNTQTLFYIGLGLQLWFVDPLAGYLKSNVPFRFASFASSLQICKYCKLEGVPWSFPSMGSSSWVKRVTQRQRSSQNVLLRDILCLLHVTTVLIKNSCLPKRWQ